MDELITPIMIEKVKEEPAKYHWSQSYLEKVTDAHVLLSGEDFVLTRTAFIAPKLLRHATWRTEDVGFTSEQLFLKQNNSKAFQDISRWFHEIMLKESYELGDFPHVDYTYVNANKRNKSFINFRQFPQGSYLIDLINAETTLFDSQGTILTGGRVSSYSGSAEENEPLLPQKRTKTLEQLSKQNRFRDGRIVVLTPNGDYESPLEQGEMIFVNYDDFTVLTSDDVGDEIVSKIHAAELGELALQKTLLRFKSLLEESALEYTPR